MVRENRENLLGELVQRYILEGQDIGRVRQAVHDVLRILLYVGVDQSVYGVENLSNYSGLENMLIVSNHEHLLDPVVMLPLLMKKVGKYVFPIAKQESFDGGLIGYFCRFGKSLPLDRNCAIAIGKSIRKLSKEIPGVSYTIYPAGARTASGLSRNGLQGDGLSIIHRFGGSQNIVPVSVDFDSVNQDLFRIGCHVCYGMPICIENLFDCNQGYGFGKRKKDHLSKILLDSVRNALSGRDMTVITVENMVGEYLGRKIEGGSDAVCLQDTVEDVQGLFGMAYSIGYWVDDRLVENKEICKKKLARYVKRTLCWAEKRGALRIVNDLLVLNRDVYGEDFHNYMAGMGYGLLDEKGMPEIDFYREDDRISDVSYLTPDPIKERAWGFKNNNPLVYWRNKVAHLDGFGKMFDDIL